MWLRASRGLDAVLALHPPCAQSQNNRQAVDALTVNIHAVRTCCLKKIDEKHKGNMRIIESIL